MNIGPETRKKMDEYDTLQKIVEQLEFCKYQTADGLHRIEDDVAFMKLKEMAKEKKKVVMNITNLCPLIVIEDVTNNKNAVARLLEELSKIMKQAAIKGE